MAAYYIAGIVPEAEGGFSVYQYLAAPALDMVPVRVSISIPKSALEVIDEKAKGAGFTRSGFLAHAALEYRIWDMTQGVIFSMRTAQALYSAVWLTLSYTGLVSQLALFSRK